MKKSLSILGLMIFGSLFSQNIAFDKLYGNSDPTHYYLGHYPVTSSDGLDINWYGGIKLQTSAGVGIQLLNNGNVGVGTTDPSSKLTVYESGPVGTNNFELRTNHLRNSDRYFMKNIVFGTGTEDLTFSLRHDGQMFVGGNVGIKTDPHPDIAFKVNGRTQVITDIDSDTFYVGNTGSNIGSGSSLVFLRYGQYQPNNPGVLDVAGWPTSSAYELMFSLKANGKLFLGTSSNISCSDCNDYRLFVKNGIRTEKIKVDIASANGWADYVFKKDYKLNSLEYVEKHIEEKGHLPNIPSAKEVVENGINLGEMNAKLLEKIEELTLYVIKLNKDFKKLEEENKKLRNNGAINQ
jgi:hypothetical protein